MTRRSTPSTRTKAKLLVSKGVSNRDVSRRLNIPLSTVKTWSRRNGWRNNIETPCASKEVVKGPVWMRSLYHECAHLVGPDGKALCGAAVPMGVTWFLAEDTKRHPHCVGLEKRLEGAQ